MISRQVQQDGGANSAPALNANLSSGHATHPRFDSDPRLASDPRFARRVVDMKWLAALLLMATGAILMFDAIWTSLGSGLLSAAAPVVSRPAATGHDLQRADRLIPVERPIERDVIRTRIEQLADDGHGTKSFTHVIVRLAQASRHLPAPNI